LARVLVSHVYSDDNRRGAALTSAAIRADHEVLGLHEEAADVVSRIVKVRSESARRDVSDVRDALRAQSGTGPSFLRAARSPGSRGLV
jgi:hypothetical protein